jgi:hypothetical protein
MTTIVRILVKGHTIDVSCGKGEQSFQWLASVVEGRLKMFNVLRKSLDEEAFIVTEIRNQAGELLNPRDKIYEHVGPSGLTVHATVETKFPVDDWENPKLNPWMQAAHIHSLTGQQWATEIEGWRINLDELKQQTAMKSTENANSSSLTSRERLNSNLLAQKIIPTSSSLVKIGFDFTEADVEMAFNLDWQAISLRWIPNFSDLLRSKLGVYLKREYSIICNIFAHYAGVGKVGQRYGMSIEEFGHALHTMKLIDWKQTNCEEDIETIFFKTFPETATQAIQNNNNSTQRTTESFKSSANTQHINNNNNNNNNGKNSANNPQTIQMITPANRNGSKATSSSAQSSITWPLMTRSHFVEAILAVALQEQLGGNNVSFNHVAKPLKSNLLALGGRSIA